jgi:hypothetical protein
VLVEERAEALQPVAFEDVLAGLPGKAQPDAEGSFRREPRLQGRQVLAAVRFDRA